MTRLFTTDGVSKICPDCGRLFTPACIHEADGYDEDDIYIYSDTCDDCFENALEEYEIRRRERIAIENEY